MKRILPFLIIISFFSCEKSLKHERFVINNSTQLVSVENPDYDTIYLIAPGSSAMIYAYEVLDTKQERENCKWLGDTLFIKNEDDSTCDKSVFIEENWSFTVTGPEKERVQKCTFTLTDEDF